MSWIAPAILGASSLVGGFLSSSSQSAAVKDAADKAAKVQEDMFKMTRNDYAPYRNVGIDDVTTAENNIHAAVKYLAFAA